MRLQDPGSSTKCCKTHSFFKSIHHPSPCKVTIHVKLCCQFDLGSHLHPVWDLRWNPDWDYGTPWDPACDPTNESQLGS